MSRLSGTSATLKVCSLCHCSLGAFLLKFMKWWEYSAFQLFSFSMTSQEVMAGPGWTGHVHQRLYRSQYDMVNASFLLLCISGDFESGTLNYHIFSVANVRKLMLFASNFYTSLYMCDLRYPVNFLFLCKVVRIQSPDKYWAALNPKANANFLANCQHNTLTFYCPLTFLLIYNLRSPENFSNSWTMGYVKFMFYMMKWGRIEMFLSVSYW